MAGGPKKLHFVGLGTLRNRYITSTVGLPQDDNTVTYEMSFWIPTILPVSHLLNNFTVLELRDG